MKEETSRKGFTGGSYRKYTFSIGPVIGGSIRRRSHSVPVFFLKNIFHNLNWSSNLPLLSVGRQNLGWVSPLQDKCFTQNQYR